MRRRDEQPPAGDQISANVSGPVSGQVVVGKQIEAHQALGDAAVAAVTQAELEQLRAAFAQLREQVAAQAPPERRDAAVERVGELERAVLDGDKPNLTTIQYVTHWFGDNLPRLAGLVTKVAVDPIVGQLVESAGEMLAGEFRQLMGDGG
jgi:hypothetical protein